MSETATGEWFAAYSENIFSRQKMLLEATEKHVEENTLDCRLLPSPLTLTLLREDLRIWQVRNDDRWPVRILMDFDQATEYRDLLAPPRWKASPALRNMKFEGIPIEITPF